MNKKKIGNLSLMNTYQVCRKLVLLTIPSLIFELHHGLFVGFRKPKRLQIKEHNLYGNYQNSQLFLDTIKLSRYFLKTRRFVRNRNIQKTRIFQKMEVSRKQKLLEVEVFRKQQPWKMKSLKYRNLLQ